MKLKGNKSDTGKYNRRDTSQNNSSTELTIREPGFSKVEKRNSYGYIVIVRRRQNFKKTTKSYKGYKYF